MQTARCEECARGIWKIERELRGPGDETCRPGENSVMTTGAACCYSPQQTPIANHRLSQVTLHLCPEKLQEK
jgi:hypothetical protein